MDQKDTNRLILQFEHLLRQVNRERINPVIEDLSIEDLIPVIDLVARCRASYLKHLYDLSKKYYDTDQFPTSDELKKLKAYRNRYIEVADGSKSVEASIQRGYLNLKR